MNDTKQQAPEPQLKTCPECKGVTVQFTGTGLNTQYRICRRYEESGHLSKEAINERIATTIRAARPSGRYA
jgi:hypothetical protein